MLKEQLLWVRYLPIIEAIREGLADLDDTSWLWERHGHKTAYQFRAEQKAFASEAATAFKFAA